MQEQSQIPACLLTPVTPQHLSKPGILSPKKASIPSHREQSPLFAQHPLSFPFLHIATETERSDKRSWATTWDEAERDAGADISICILEDLWAAGTSCSAPWDAGILHLRRPQWHLQGHPCSACCGAPNMVSKRSPERIKQKKNERFLRCMQKVNYGAT